MGLQIREMMYEKIKINKILSRITGKPEEQVLLDNLLLMYCFSTKVCCSLIYCMLFILD
jgi:hypothetical protein